MCEDLHETQVAEVDESPHNESSNGSNVQQPSEDSLAVLRQVEEGQQTEQRAERDRPVGGAVSVGLLEDGASGVVYEGYGAGGAGSVL